MMIFQKIEESWRKLLRIIGVNRDVARIKYGIEDISVFIERTGLEQTMRVLNTSTHSLPNSLLSNRTSHSTFPFTIPMARTSKFNESMVLKALRHLRENVHGTRRKVGRLQTGIRNQAAAINVKAKTTEKCPRCNRQFKRLSMHKCKVIIEHWIFGTIFPPFYSNTFSFFFSFVCSLLFIEY